MVEALSYAIDIGYRHVDTAHVYRVEPEVGEIINKKIRDGVITRGQIFVTTKVCTLLCILNASYPTVSLLPHHCSLRPLGSVRDKRSARTHATLL